MISFDRYNEKMIRRISLSKYFDVLSASTYANVNGNL